ncbi:hypothetical protein SUDANB58_05586 [Streptomyces sp. enrichment culture]
MDALGLVVAAVVLAANTDDNTAGIVLLDQVAEYAGGSVREALVDQGFKNQVAANGTSASVVDGHGAYGAMSRRTANTETPAQLYTVGAATRSCSPGQPQRVSDSPHSFRRARMVSLMVRTARSTSRTVASGESCSDSWMNAVEPRRLPQ